MKTNIVLLIAIVIAGFSSTIVGCATGDYHRGSILNNPMIVQNANNNIDVKATLIKIGATIELIKNIKLGPDATEKDIEKAINDTKELFFYLDLAIQYLETVEKLEDFTEIKASIVTAKEAQGIIN